MTISRLKAFAGRPHNFNGIDIYSPTINNILDIDEDQYYYHLLFASFDKGKILIDLFNYDLEKYDLLKDQDDYLVLTSHRSIIQYICSGLSFFVRKDVYFDDESKSFCIDKIMLCNSENYRELSDIINALNVVENKKKEIKFKNNKAKEIFEKMAEFRNKTKKQDEQLELKDILSILCNAEDNGINIFNVFNLTIYQVYEEMERVGLKDTFKRILPVWANGHLGEKDKLPEWIKRTKL
ncbi:hypothetical protein [Paenibacillus tianjinensis]|uniref:Uncharacterized protein n=1 Tax=Paenibacillus tianjinensis TaxID=2810347 RepID=A0ABX7L6H3_9BACL|nr:hypothetical protein [Paenibacillus tianjinensis]QSF43537.1 hypothetical protein JRJ22_19950 [Paenibacillus tianjinensis]